MGLLSRHRWRRRWASGSPILLGAIPLFAAAIPLMISVIAPTETPLRKKDISIHTSFFIQHSGWFLFAGILVATCLLLLRWRSEYRRRTFDPTWVMKFWDIFESEPMKRTRGAAARDIQDHSDRLGYENFLSPNIDDVLDFFEDLGFYIHGDQLTPEVAHHAFYYWIHGYYIACRPYIECKQIERPNQWQWVPWLFEITHEMEVKNNRTIVRKTMTDDEKRRFLVEETTLLNQAR